MLQRERGHQMGSNITAKVRAVVYARDDYRCQWCGKFIPDGASRSIQHIKKRSQSGNARPQDLVSVCGSLGTVECHGYIEGHPEEARTRGFNVHGWTDDSEMHEAQRAHQRWDGKWLQRNPDGSSYEVEKNNV